MAVLCAVLAVSRSGVYAYAQRHATPRIDRAEVVLLARVKAIDAETGQSYGSRRMAKQLQAEGYAVGRDKARRLMRDAAWWCGVARGVAGDYRQSAWLCGGAESPGPAV